MVDIALVNDFILKEASTPLGVLRFMAQIYTAEIRFNMNRTVDFLSKVSADSDLFFAYSRDMTGVSRTEDVSELTTRLYPYGGGAVGISTVNGGRAYLEDYSFYDSRGLPRRTRVTLLKHPRIYIASSLLDWAKRKIKELAQPRMTYEVSLAILDPQQVPKIGQYVRVWDEPFGMNVYPRVVGREHYPLERGVPPSPSTPGRGASWTRCKRRGSSGRTLWEPENSLPLR